MLQKFFLSSKWYRIGFWIVIITGCLIIFFGPTDNWSWDPSYYYAQLRSPVIDNDLNFRNETITNGVITRKTVTGLQASPWPIGPSIMWSPFFLLAHILVVIIDPSKATGFSFPYIALVSFGSFLYGLMSLIIIYKISQLFGNRFISAIAILLCMGATPLFYYTFRQPIMAHTTGLLASSVLFLYYIRITEYQLYSEWSGFIFGVLLGLCFLTRWSGVLFAVFPLTYFASQIIRAIQTNNYSKLPLVLQQIIIMITIFGLTISPQLSLWYRLHSKPVVFPQDPSSFVDNLFPINTLKVLFDTNRGLLFWSPFILISMFGIGRIPNIEIKVSAIICIVSHLILIGYRRDWFGGGGYGPRYFIELIPVLVVGFIHLFKNNSTKSFGRWLLVICAICLITHQAVLIYAVEHGSDGWIDLARYLNGQPLGLDWQMESFLKLIKNPDLWLIPRPFVSKERQAILVNLFYGIRDFRLYRLTGTAAALMPIAIIVGFLVKECIKKISLPKILAILVIYNGFWSFFLLTRD